MFTELEFKVIMDLLEKANKLAENMYQIGLEILEKETV